MEILLRPIAGKSVILRLGAGKIPLDTGQSLWVPVQVEKRGATTQLATGGALEDLTGTVALYRGSRFSEARGKFHDNAIVCAATSSAEDGRSGGAAAFDVQLFLDEILFDQIVRVSCGSGRLSAVGLFVDFLEGPIRYGGAPDGSQRVWNNVENAVATVEGFSLATSLPIDLIASSDDVPTGSLLAFTSALDQMNQRSREFQALMAQMRVAVKFLQWAIVAALVLLLLVKLQ